MSQRFYVTAAIDYVNSAPHLGTAYEKVGCDVLARYWSSRGSDVRFTMGSDEHSQSVERAARDRGMDPEAFCVEQAEVFQALWAQFGIRPTAYVRTNGAENRASTERFMGQLHQAGHIYKDWYRAWFCPSCEQFYTAKQIVGGLCPVHERAVEWVEEENYFFRLSAFQEPLLEHFDKHPDFLTPPSRRNEILNVLRGGLEDISISRGFTAWGFPLPFDSTQVIYVWFDALLSYVTGIGFAHDPATFANFWPADVHVIGKDITRFHAVMWPAMLMAAGLPLPKRIHAHGFVTLGGEKLSKTRGIFLDPHELLDKYGSDAVRWVLLSEIPFDRDGDFSVEVFVDRYNADLANDYGNLVSRTQKMVAKYFDGVVPPAGLREPEDDDLRVTAEAVVVDFDAAMHQLAFADAISAVRRLVGKANKYIEDSAPWRLQESGSTRLGTVLCEVLEALRVSTLLLHPFIPKATERVAGDLHVSIDGDQTDAVRGWNALSHGAPCGVGPILFPRLVREEVTASS